LGDHKIFNSSQVQFYSNFDAIEICKYMGEYFFENGVGKVNKQAREKVLSGVA
jgi:hypothetical protein